MAVGSPPRAAKNDAVAVTAIGVRIVPDVISIQTDESLRPPGAIEVRPLIGKSQVGLDDRSADGLQVQDARKPLEIAGDPSSARSLDLGIGRRMNGPTVEH